MNYSLKLFFSLVMLSSLSCFSMMLEKNIRYEENKFTVLDGEHKHQVQPHFVDSLLKRMNPEQLKTFVEQGNHIRAIRLNNGEHRLQAMVAGNGGFVGTALAAYFSIQAATLALCVAFPPAAVVIAPVGQILAGAAAATLAVTPTP